MTPKTLEFVFDFGSPNAYLCWKALPPILRRTGARVEVRPCLLGGLFKATGNQSPMAAFAQVRGKLAYEALETRRFVARHGLSAFAMNPHFPVNTLLLMRGLVAARLDRTDARYLEAGLKAMWEDGLKMDDPVVFRSAMDAAGLDGAALLARTQGPEVKAGLVAETERAAARGAFGVPTFFVGDEMFFGKERLAQVEEALAV